MLSFFVEVLSGLRPLRESDCSVTSENIIRSGLAFGQRIKTEDPQRVVHIFQEIGEAEVAGVREVVESVVVEAGGTDPDALTASILEWNERNNEWHDLKYYGQRLDRLVYCADFAVWVPWVSQYNA
jgi:hypothetical protein